MDLTRGFLGLGWAIAWMAACESEKTAQFKEIAFLIMVSAFRTAESSAVNVSRVKGCIGP